MKNHFNEEVFINQNFSYTKKHTDKKDLSVKTQDYIFCYLYKVLLVTLYFFIEMYEFNLSKTLNIAF